MSAHKSELLPTWLYGSERLACWRNTDIDYRENRMLKKLYDKEQIG